MSWVSNICEKLAEIPEVEEITVSDNDGELILGTSKEDAEELAAALTFTGQAAFSLEESMGLDWMKNITLIGKKSRIIILPRNDFYFGIKLRDGSVISRVEKQIENSFDTLQLLKTDSDQIEPKIKGAK